MSKVRRLPPALLRLLAIGALVLSAGCEAPPAIPIPSETPPPLVQIATTYRDSRDLIAARAALAGLGLTDPTTAIAQMAQQEAAAGRVEPARALAELAQALEITPAPATLDAVPIEPIATQAQASPTPSPDPGFALVSREDVCERAISRALLEVFTQDPTGQQIGGYEIQVEWNGGADRFFTGLKPEIGPGYGDFVMEPGVSYVVRLADYPQARADTVIAPTCATEASAYAGGVRLVFREVEGP
ncbi:MAG TPA: hypothetical protein PLC98_21730 [Anaerolineales bacterium]|nr:hypothetical protein [Anaerolineales bacterium]